MTVAEKIRFFRQEKGLQQKQLAELSGVQVKTIQRYEHGAYEPTQKTLRKIADAINIPLQCFLSIEELVEQHKPFLLSLPVNKRIQVFRYSKGWTKPEFYFHCFLSEIENPDENYFDKFIDSIENGTFQVSVDMAFFISCELNIPMELLGFSENELLSSVPPNPIPDNIDSLIKEQEQEEIRQLTEIFTKMDSYTATLFRKYINSLNSEGKQKLLDYAKDLSQLEKYTTPDPDSGNEE